MEAEGEAGEHDEKDNRNRKEGEDDVFEDDDVVSDPVEESHVKEEVDPGQSDGTGSNLPLEARRIQEEAVECQKDGEAVDEEVKEEDEWQLWFLPLHYTSNALDSHLIPKRGELAVPKEENHPCNIQHKKKATEPWVPFRCP